MPQLYRSSFLNETKVDSESEVKYIESYSVDNNQILYVNLMVKVIDVIFELDVTGFS